MMTDAAKKSHYFVGLDIHKEFTAGCIIDTHGTIVREETVRGGSRAVCLALAKAMAARGGSCDVVFEVGDGYGLWHRRLSAVARRVMVAHPAHLKTIWNTRRKTDRIDARKLARLLLLELIQPVHVPDIDVRDWRTLIQHRRSLVTKRTAIKNKVRALLQRNHIEDVPKNLWSKKNLLWLAQVALPSPGEGLQRDMLLEDLAHHSAQIGRAEQELDLRAEAHPAVQLLKTILQVGNRTAEAVVAWIDPPGRFARTKQLGAYFGFAASVDASAGKQRLGHITRQGPAAARHMLVEAIHRMKRTVPLVRGWVEHFMHGQKKRKHIAVVAAAHKLLRCMFAMLRAGRPWAGQAAGGAPAAA